MNHLYVVLTLVPRRLTLRVGSLGEVTFDRGWYAYVGSAKRGREARVARHLAPAKPLRWHADYLSTAVPPRSAWLVDTDLDECALAAALMTAVPASSPSPPRFGAGDCSCAGHLLRLGRRPRRLDVRQAAGPGAVVTRFRVPLGIRPQAL